MFRKLIEINNNIFEWYFNHKETKASQLVMFWLWFALLFKIFVDLTNWGEIKWKYGLNQQKAG